MTDRLRAVFDTNVFVSAFLSRNPSEEIRITKAPPFLQVLRERSGKDG